MSTGFGIIELRRCIATAQ